VIVPGVLYSILFVTGILFFSSSATQVIEYFTQVTGISDFIQRYNSGLAGFLFAFSGIILWLVLMFFYFSFFKHLWLILGSPLFAYLSEKTQAIFEEREFSFTYGQLWKVAMRGTRIALRNMLWQTVYLIGLLILAMIPVAGWIAPLIALFVECYYYGFSMMDYTAERYNQPVKKSMEFISTHKGLAIGNGIMFYLMHGLIFVGWIFAPAYAVISATLSMYKVNRPAA